MNVIAFISKKIEDMERQLKKENPFYIRNEDSEYFSIKIPASYFCEEDKKLQYKYGISLNERNGSYFKVSRADSRMTDSSRTYNVWLEDTNPLTNTQEGLLYNKLRKSWEYALESELRSRSISKSKVIKEINKLILDDFERENPHLTEYGLSYIYLINITGTDLYKIGVSNNPQNRLQTLQTASPFDMEIIETKSTPLAYKVENKLHKIFDKYKHKNEWFKLDSNQVEIFKGIDLRQLLTS